MSGVRLVSLYLASVPIQKGSKRITRNRAYLQLRRAPDQLGSHGFPSGGAGRPVGPAVRRFRGRAFTKPDSKSSLRAGLVQSRWQLAVHFTTRCCLRVELVLNGNLQCPSMSR